MSGERASERLRALDEAVSRDWFADWLVGDDIAAYSAGIFDGRFRVAITDSDKAAIIAILRNALPEIIAALRVLERIRQWDMLNPGADIELTADAPYWRSEIDRTLDALASKLSGEGQG